MQHVPNDDDPPSCQITKVALRGIQVEQRLGGMGMGSIPGVDNRNVC